MRSARLRGSAHGRGGSARPAECSTHRRTVWEPSRARRSSRWPNRRRLGLLFAHPSFRRSTSGCIRRTRSNLDESFLVRCCVSGLATDSADADPRRRFLPAVEAFTLHAPTSDAPLRFRAVISRHRRVSSNCPISYRPALCQMQAPGDCRVQAPGGHDFRRIRASVLPRDLEPPFSLPGLRGNGRKARGA